MKKLLTITISLFILSISSFAQLQRHEFSFSAGLYSSNFLDAVSYDIFTDQNFDQSISKTTEGLTGALYFSYSFHPRPALSIGISGGFERVKGKIHGDNFLEGMYYNDYISGGLEINYRYVNKPSIQVYSGGGLGLMFNEETNELPDNYEFNESFNFAYQINIVGLRFGGVFGVFLEAGYGYKGMLKAGISLQL